MKEEKIAQDTRENATSNSGFCTANNTPCKANFYFHPIFICHLFSPLLPSFLSFSFLINI